jgi:Cysteine-rich secretory protein family
MNNRTVRFFSLLLSLIALFSFSFSGSSSQAAPLFVGCGATQVAVVDPVFEATIVELVNEERTKNNLPPMKHSLTLSDAARYHAADMDQDDYFLHDTYDKLNDQLAKQCTWVERIKTFYATPRAENIAKGFTSPETVMRAWMESAGHRKNILADYWEIGAGYFGNEWVQDFGTPADTFPLIINREARDTDSINVALYVYGNWTQMRLRNDDGAWGEWQPFSHDVTWTLHNAQGVRTVTVELSDGVRTVASSDSIELITSATVPESPTPSPTATIPVPAPATPTPIPDPQPGLLFLPILVR